MQGLKACPMRYVALGVWASFFLWCHSIGYAWGSLLWHRYSCSTVYSLALTTRVEALRPLVVPKSETIAVEPSGLLAFPMSWTGHQSRRVPTSASERISGRIKWTRAIPNPFAGNAAGSYRRWDRMRIWLSRFFYSGVKCALSKNSFCAIDLALHGWESPLCMQLPEKSPPHEICYDSAAEISFHFFKA